MKYSLTCLILVFLSSFGYTQSKYDFLTSKANSVDIVIEGTIINKRVIYDSTLKYNLTEYEVDISRQFKGEQMSTMFFYMQGGIDESGNGDLFSHVPSLNIDRNFAANNNVFIISTNESFGEMSIETNESSSRTSNITAYISEVKITDKKESWWGGNADVSIIGTQTSVYDDGNGCEETTAFIRKSIVKISNSELNTWTEVDDIFHFINSLVDSLISNPENTGEGICFTIYEHDNRYSRRVTYPTRCGFNVQQYYSSKQSYYGKFGEWTCLAFDACDNIGEYEQVIEY